MSTFFPFLPSWSNQLGPALRFGLNIVEESLYIEKVFSPDHKDLVGARVQAINRIPLSELLNRLKFLVGWDNESQLLTYLCRFLDDISLLEILIPQGNSDESF